MPDAFDIQRARADTPGTEHVLHFNNAGAALQPLPVLEAVTDYLSLEACIGGYEAALEGYDAMEHTYDAIARLLRADRDDIAIVDSATTAWQRAFYSMPFERGDRVLVARASYASNFIALLQRQQRDGIAITVVPDEASGQVDVTALAEAIDARTRLICLTHVPTGGGLVNPAADVGQIARAAGVPYLLDACQSAGQLPLDVDALGCDMLSATGRKYLRGPRGTGFLYVRPSMMDRLDPHVLDLHSAEWTAPDTYRVRQDARRFETWERNPASHIGLGVAADYALDWGLEAIRDRVQSLAGTLRAALTGIEGVQVLDQGCEKSGLVTFTKEGGEASVLVAALRAMAMNTSLAVQSGTRLDWEARGLDEAVRASVHYYNTEAEVERFVDAVDAL